LNFSVSSAFVPVDQLAPIAVAADELGYRSMSVPDHVVDLETLSTPYPYTEDGSRRWNVSAPWPDPWVLIGALAAVTKQLRFYTAVYVAPMRNPFLVAKAVATAAALSGNRVALGIGTGWCAEEFALMEQPFRGRGKRADEALELIARLWEPGWTEFHGEFYSCPRLRMEPTPTQRIPILVGGVSDAALARAARHDGWIGDLCTIDEATALAGKVHGLRAAAGREGDFGILQALTDALVPADFERAARGGVTEVITKPWAYYYGPDCPLEKKLDGLARFANDILRPLGS